MMIMHLQEEFDSVGLAFLGHNGALSEMDTNFGDGWEQKYVSEDFARIDPVIGKVASSGARSTTYLLSEREMSSELFEEAKAYNANSNFGSVSMFGGSCMVVGGVNADLDERALPRIQAKCYKLHLQLLMQKIDRLRTPQIELLELSEEGLLEKEIAYELGISQSAIVQRKKTICGNVGVASFKAAVSLYTMRKWSGIVPGDTQQIW